MKFLPKIVTLSFTLALLGGVGAAWAQDSIIDKQTQNLSVDNSINPVETALENIEEESLLTS